MAPTLPTSAADRATSGTPSPGAGAGAGADLWQALGRTLETQAHTPPPTAVPRDRPLPLSFAQEGVWLAHRSDPGSAAYNVPLAWQLTGPLEVTALERSLGWVIERHEILRSRIVPEGGQPRQVVGQTPAQPLRVVSFEDRPAAARAAAARAWVEEEIRQPVALVAGPLLRTSLLRLSATEHVLVLVLHHLAIDAWSQRVLWRDWSAAYRACRDGVVPAAPAGGLQSADFAAWQRACWASGTWNGQREFWKTELTGHPPTLDLPLDHPRPPTQTFRGAVHRFRMAPDLLRALDELRRTTGATRNVLLLAAFQALLHRYTGQEDLLVGAPVAMRGRPEFRGAVGFLLNLQALRTRLDAETPFAELVARANRTSLNAYAHPDVPFEKLVEDLRPERDGRHTPLLQAVFVYQNVPGRNPNLPDVRAQPLALHNGTAKFELTLQFEEAPEGPDGFWEFNTDLFAPETIARMTEQFQILLRAAALNPNQCLADLPLVSDAERRQVVVEWNQTRTAYPRDRCIHQVFEEQVERSPDAVALVSGATRLTYRQLNHRANRLAARLRDRGVGPDVPVALCAERSPGLIVALLAILKAGGAYVPLDPDYPPARLALMLADTRAPVWLVQPPFANRLPAHSANVMPLEELPESDEPASNLPCATTPENLAYVIYTSGSTGTPKGTAIPHRSVVRLVRETNFADLGPGQVFLQFAPVSFDASTFEIWAPLLNGGRLVLMPPGADALLQLGAVIREQGVTTLWLTAGLFNVMVDEHLAELRGLRQLLAGGEALSLPHVQRARAGLPGCRLINGYGPTENTTFTTCHTIGTADLQGASIPIGQPIANTTVFVLDPRGRPAPIGVPGELVIGGDGLARGYLNQPELTREKFIPNPFSAEPGARLYRTGDRARWRADGTLEFLGRMDRQLKIRGFRVEPGEIESQLGAQPGVQQCAVVLREGAPGRQRLVAYVVPKPGVAPEPAQWTRELKRHLPDYMVPSAFVALDALPLTPSGKLDRRALPPPSETPAPAGRAVRAPRDNWERELVALWEKLLGVQPVSVDDDFFALGGHSLLAARMFAELDQTFGLQVPLALLFEAPTIEQLAQAIRRRKQTVPWQTLVPIQPRGSRPPMFWLHTLGGGGGGGLLRYRALANLLGPDQPSIGIEAPHEPFTDIPTMATHYVAAIRQHQPRGPYYLGGYCFGGVVACEMARQLEAQGEPVGLLAVLDSATPAVARGEIPFRLSFLPTAAANVWFKLIALARGGPARLAAQLRHRFRPGPAGRPRGLAGRALGDIIDMSQYPDGYRHYAEVHWQALTEFQPKPYAGKLVLFRARHQSLFNFEPTSGFSQIARGGVEVKMVPGVHETLLEPPTVLVLAEKLRACLEAAHQRHAPPERAA